MSSCRTPRRRSCVGRSGLVLAAAVAGLVTVVCLRSATAEERKFAVWLANVPKSGTDPTMLPNRDDIRAAYFDRNRNNDTTEPFVDADGDGVFDAGEAFTDLNGNGRRDAGIRSYAEYWEEISYGDVTITGDVLGWFNLPWPVLPPGQDAVSAVTFNLPFTNLTRNPGFDWGAGEVFDESEQAFIIDLNGDLPGPTDPPPGLFDGVWTPGERFRDLDGDGVYDGLFEPIGDGDGDGIIDTSDPDPMNHEFLDLDGNGQRAIPEPFEDFMRRWDPVAGEWVVVTNLYIFNNYPGFQARLMRRKPVTTSGAPELKEDAMGRVRVFETNIVGLFDASDIGGTMRIFSAAGDINGDYTIIALDDDGSAVTVATDIPGMVGPIILERDIMITPDMAFIFPDLPGTFDSGTAGEFGDTDVGAFLEISSSGAGNNGRYVIQAITGGGRAVNVGGTNCPRDGILGFAAYEGAEPDPNEVFPPMDLDDPPDGINDDEDDEYLDRNNSGTYDSGLSARAKVLTRIVVNPDGRTNNNCYDGPDSWTERGNTKMMDTSVSSGDTGAVRLATPRPTWLGDPFIETAEREPLALDVNGDGFFDRNDGDLFSVNDLNGNGHWDFGEPLAIDINGNGVLEAGDVFSFNDTNNNGIWEPGEPLATDVDGDGEFDPADGDVFDANDTDGNGQWDAGEPLALDLNQDGAFDPGDLFDANDRDGNGGWNPLSEPFTDTGNGVREGNESFDDFGHDGIPNTNDPGEGNGVYDGPEPLSCDRDRDGMLEAADGDIFNPARDDLNGNGRWDSGEPFVDRGNGVWDGDEPFTDTNGNGKWDPAEPFVDENSNCTWDFGEAFTDMGNGIWDAGEVLTLDQNGDGMFDPGDEFVDEPNGRWDPAEGFFDRNGNGRWDAAEPFVDLNANGAWDPGFTDVDNDGQFDPGWWFERYASSPPEIWDPNIPTVIPFDPTAARTFEPNRGDLDNDDPAADIFPDLLGAYDGFIEFDDLPSSMYHTLGGDTGAHGGDLRLGEVTSTTVGNGSIWGQDLAPPPVGDNVIPSGGPPAVGVHGTGGADAGNMLNLELNTWRLNGLSTTEPRISQTIHPFYGRLDFPGYRDWNLDGLVDQGETRDPDTENYVVDAFEATANNGATSLYPFNRRRLMEDVVEALDADVDWDRFVDQGNPGVGAGFRQIPLSGLAQIIAPNRLRTGLPQQFRPTDVGNIVQIANSVLGNNGIYVINSVSLDGADVTIDTTFGAFTASEGPPLTALVFLIPFQGSNTPALRSVVSGIAILPADSGAGEHLRRPAPSFFPVPTLDADAPFLFSDIVSSLGASIEGATVARPSAASTDFLTAFAAHEYLHTWEGYPDLYDYDVYLPGPQIINAPVGPWDVMAEGGLVHPAPALKTISAWVEPIDLTTVMLPNVPQKIVLPPSEFVREDAFYFMENPVFPGERYWFWAIANQGFSTSLPWQNPQTPPGFQTGMLVMHTDLGANPEALPNQQRIESHFTYQIVQADGLQELEAGRDFDGDLSVADPGDPFPGRSNVRELSADTDPNTRWFNGVQSGLDVLDVVPQPGGGVEVTFLWTPREVPTLRFTKPPGGTVVGSRFVAEYEAFDLFGGTSIEIFIDTNSSGYDGASLNPGNPLVKPEGFVRDAFSFDISNLANGVYFLYAKLTPGAGSDAQQEFAWSRVRASSRNQGSGDLEILDVNLDVSKVESWTVICIDDTTPGSELWSVNGSSSGDQMSATTGVDYTTNGGEVTFRVASGAERFRVGDRFTFLTTGLTPYSKRFEIVDGGAVPQPTAVLATLNCPTPPQTCAGPAPFTVQFDASGSSDPRNRLLEYEWDFDDGTTAGPAPNLQFVDHTFTAPGTYVVRLTVRNRSGGVDTTTKTVTASNTAPISVITATLADGSLLPVGPIQRNPDGTVRILFDALSSSDPNGDPLTEADFEWRFGDPLSGPDNVATGRMVEHTYTMGGFFQVTLTVSDPSGSSGKDILTLDIESNRRPVIENATADPTSGTVPLTVNFSAMASDPDGDTIQFEWRFGDATPPAFGPTATHEYAQVGSFPAKLIVRDLPADSRTEITFTIQVQAAGGGTPGGGGPTPGQVQAVMTATPTTGAPGTTVRFNAAGSSTGSTVTYEWDFGDGSPLERGGPITHSQLDHVYRRIGVFTASLRVLNTANGANALDSEVITISSTATPPAGRPNLALVRVSPTSGAAPLDVNFDARDVAGAVDWVWTFGDGTGAQGVSAVSHIYRRGGTFDVRLRVTTADGQQFEDAVAAILVSPGPGGLPPVARIQPPQPSAGLAPLTVQFSAEGSTDPDNDIIQYEWDFGDGSTPVLGLRATHVYRTAGQFTVVLTVEDASGRTSSTQTVITVAPDTGPVPGQPLPPEDPGEPQEPGVPFPLCGFGSMLAMSGTILGWMGMKVVMVRGRRRRD